jgi:hypothetical protein
MPNMSSIVSAPARERQVFRQGNVWSFDGSNEFLRPAFFEHLKLTREVAQLAQGVEQNFAAPGWHFQALLGTDKVKKPDANVLAIVLTKPTRYSTTSGCPIPDFLSPKALPPDQWEPLNNEWNLPTEPLTDLVY